MQTIVEKTQQSIELIASTVAKHRTAVATSFGKDSMVVMHLALTVDPQIQVFSILTKYKPRETFEFRQVVEEEFDIEIPVFMSAEDACPKKDGPDECCRRLKVLPTELALKNLDVFAWITGLRRTEGQTRTDFKEVEETKLTDWHLIHKINPILDWTELDIWRYTAIHELPIHPWYKLGYRSLSCAPCTRRVDDSETERAGRWAGTKKQGGECGMHTMFSEKPKPPDKRIIIG